MNTGISGECPWCKTFDCNEICVICNCKLCEKCYKKMGWLCSIKCYNNKLYEELMTFFPEQKLDIIEIPIEDCK